MGRVAGWGDAATGASVLGTGLECCGEKTLMLGGETAMWGEGINEDNFDAL